jgi:hypothetical protein
MVIATRRLKLQLPPNEIDISVRIFLPEVDNEGWRCAYEIDWPDGKRSSAAAGVDSVQALFLALQKIGIDIYTSDYHRQGQLVWFEADQGYRSTCGALAKNLLRLSRIVGNRNIPRTLTTKAITKP